VEMLLAEKELLTGPGPADGDGRAAGG
jgi:hypothetical protein